MKPQGRAGGSRGELRGEGIDLLHGSDGLLGYTTIDVTTGKMKVPDSTI